MMWLGQLAASSRDRLDSLRLVPTGDLTRAGASPGVGAPLVERLTPHPLRRTYPSLSVANGKTRRS